MNERGKRSKPPVPPPGDRASGDRAKPPGSSAAPPPAERSKRPSQPPPPDRAPSPHPIGTPRGVSSSSGIMAVSAWLVQRGLYPPAGKPWKVEIALDVVDRPAPYQFAPTIDTRFHITIEPDAWSFMFCHHDRTSTIRVGDTAQVVGRDEHRLLASTPTLKALGTFIRDLEQRYRVFFQRNHATVRSNIAGGEPIIRAWVSSL